MNISQRGTGNTNLLKEIQQASKKISQESGLAESMRIFPEQVKVDESKLGAAASLGINNKAKISEDSQKMLQQMFSSSSNDLALSSNKTFEKKAKFDFTKSSLNRIMDDIELLCSTRDFYNATQSLLSLYALGFLDSSVLNKMSRDDLSEIKGIIREFKSILDGC